VDGHCYSFNIDFMERFELKELCKKLKLENEQLKKYVQHTDLCKLNQDDMLGINSGKIHKCTCGLNKLLKEVKCQ
jgi:hypothetical protein